MQISYKFAQNVKAQLDKTESRILGVVLNKVDMSTKSYGHYGKHTMANIMENITDKYGNEGGHTKTTDLSRQGAEEAGAEAGMRASRKLTEKRPMDSTVEESAESDLNLDEMLDRGSDLEEG